MAEEQATPAEHVQQNHRQHKLKKNSTKYNRFKDEVAYVDAFTKQFLAGDLEAENIMILADVKSYLMQLKGNPYNLKERQANAFVHNDLRQLCIDGAVIGDKKIVLKAKAIGSRVTYYNPVLAQELIRDEKDPAVKKTMEERFKLLKDLPNRPGYGCD